MRSASVTSRVSVSGACLIPSASSWSGVKGVGRVSFTHRDVVRHDLVARIVDAYDRRDAQRKNTPEK